MNEKKKKKLFILILIGIVLILLFIALAGPINAAIAGLILGSLFLIYIAIYMLFGIVSYFEKTESSIKFAWAPEPFVFSKKDLVKAIIILGLSIAGLILLWTVVAHHPLLYPHLKKVGII